MDSLLREGGRPWAGEKGADLHMRLEEVIADLMLGDSREAWSRGRCPCHFFLLWLYRLTFLWHRLALVTVKKIRVLRFWQS